MKKDIYKKQLKSLEKKGLTSKQLIKNLTLKLTDKEKKELFFVP